MTRCGEQGVKLDDPAKRLTVHDRMAVGLAKSVSQSVRLQPVRDFLKSEAGSRFDEDYDILLQEVRNNPVHGMKGGGRSSSPTFGEVLFGGSAASNGRSSAAGGEALLDSLGALFPLMQIAIPALENQTVETWNTASHKPLVAVLPQDYQEGVTKTITAFDAEGREYEIDAEKQPENLVMVISHNERLIAVPRGANPERGRTKSECLLLYFSSSTHDYYRNDYTSSNCGGGGGGGFWGDSGGGGTGLCLRTDGSYEFLRGLYLSQQAFNRFEGWPAGAPEIHPRVFFPVSSTILDQRNMNVMEPRRRNDIRDQWWDRNNSIAVWDRSQRGSTWAFTFIEDDAELFIQLKEITVSGKFKLPGGGEATLSAKFNVGTLDEDMGNYFVDFCPNPPLTIAGSRCYDPSDGFYFRLGR
jgi:hypothetical protein